ncbi:MAG: ring-oxidation complex protein 1 in the phenylacetic acid catabolism pathway [Hyphococcus sp.]|nr:MAG: ring-oxidation complex protein 1 in the phenylacetic acid catabolism pathway [Marinicaulis sp.]
MSDENDIMGYLEKGGKLTAPDNAPPRYRAELLRIMASFVDSELAGAAGFADIINQGPGITERIAASRIVLEKFDHGERVLKIMGDFGANTSRYQSVHPWNARVKRSDDLGSKRREGDMRLNVLHYPIEGWADAVVMNVLMGHATLIQLKELSRGSYQPLAEVFQEILPRERRHCELGEDGLAQLASEGAKENIAECVKYWRPRVAASFGDASSPRFEMLRKFGLRHTKNDALQNEWSAEIDKALSNALG